MFLAAATFAGAGLVMDRGVYDDQDEAMGRTRMQRFLDQAFHASELEVCVDKGFKAEIVGGPAIDQVNVHVT